jgi:hypothetical protein
VRRCDCVALNLPATVAAIISESPKFTPAHLAGVAFVVDASARSKIDESRQALEQVLGHPKMQGATVLVLANKQDKETAMHEHSRFGETACNANGSCIKPREFTDAFPMLYALASTERCNVVGVSALTDAEGLRSAFKWLGDNLISKAQYGAKIQGTYTAVCPLCDSGEAHLECVLEHDVYAGFGVETKGLGWVTGSKKIGKISVGQKIRVVEVRKNTKQTNRIRFRGPLREDGTQCNCETLFQCACKLREGWVSETQCQKGGAVAKLFKADWDRQLSADAGAAGAGAEPEPEFESESGSELTKSLVSEGVPTGRKKKRDKKL